MAMINVFLEGRARRDANLKYGPTERGLQTFMSPTSKSSSPAIFTTRAGKPRYADLGLSVFETPSRRSAVQSFKEHRKQISPDQIAAPMERSCSRFGYA